MKYSKKHVNEIVDEILNLTIQVLQKSIDTYEFDKEVALLREEHLLVDRRMSSAPEYSSAIIRDFMEFKLSYKDIMKKYHCSMRTLKSLLLECAENDERLYMEIESRRHS